MSHSIIVEGVAGADLSLLQFTAVLADAADSDQIKTSTNPALLTTVGILQNAPGDDGRAYVCVSGVCTAIAGAVIAPFALLMVGPGGKLITATSGNHVIGQYIPGVSSDPATDAEDAADEFQIRVLVFANKVTQHLAAP